MAEGLIVLGVIVGGIAVIMWACLTVDKEDVVNDDK